MTKMYYVMDTGYPEGSAHPQYTSEDGNIKVIYRKNNKKWAIMNTAELEGRTK